MYFSRMHSSTWIPKSSPLLWYSANYGSVIRAKMSTVELRQIFLLLDDSQSGDMI